MKITNELKRLSDFGLNPVDWKIKPTTKKIFKIVHKDDSNFILNGRFENQAWKKIWLHSI